MKHHRRHPIETIWELEVQEEMALSMIIGCYTTKPQE